MTIENLEKCEALLNSYITDASRQVVMLEAEINQVTQQLRTLQERKKLMEESIDQYRDVLTPVIPRRMNLPGANGDEVFGPDEAIDA
jgi:uncharacterized coiled-coil protein SlyX